MTYREAGSDDLDLLAHWNAELILDEGHRNPMSIPELLSRMRGWLEGEYRACIFTCEEDGLGYALYRESADEIHLRQFFVVRGQRRRGNGRQMLSTLRDEIWPREKRFTVDVLVKNAAAVAFWRSVGFQDYALTLEIRADETG